MVNLAIILMKHLAQWVLMMYLVFTHLILMNATSSFKKM